VVKTNLKLNKAKIQSVKTKLNKKLKLSETKKYFTGCIKQLAVLL